MPSRFRGAALVGLLAPLALTSVAAAGTLNLDFLGRFETGIFDDGGAEIVTYDTATQYVFFVNAAANQIVALDISDPTNPVEAYSIDVTATAGGGGANSIDARDGIVAVAVEAEVKQDPGFVALYNAETGNLISTYPAGALPDMVTFSADGTKIVVANEGEPNADYTNDPEGSVTLIDFSGGATPSDAEVTQIDLALTFPEILDSGVRIFGPGATRAQDMEPEYIALSSDGNTAWVALQENNAFARFDLERKIITDIQPLGYKDHSQPGNEIDPSDRDGAIANWPVFGMYMPDAIASFEVDGETFIISANEGDAREYDTFEEEDRVKDLDLDPTAFPNADELQADAQLGRLTITTIQGDTDNDGDFDELYCFGTRSITIWNEDGELVWDSGADLEQITAAAYPDDFNANNDENDSFESRSDNKGPEPEGVAIGELNGQIYAFVGLERIGGVVVYNVTDPADPTFVTYENSRDFSGDAEGGTAGDLGPEGIEFIGGDVSPNGATLLAVGNEVSGTVSLYAVLDGSTVADAEVPTTHASSGLSVVSANPFADSVSLRFQTSTDGPRSVEIYAANGRLVRTLVSGQGTAGTEEVSWDGRNDSGVEVSSGVYFARMASAETLVVRRLVLSR